MWRRRDAEGVIFGLEISLTLRSRALSSSAPTPPPPHSIGKLLAATAIKLFFSVLPLIEKTLDIFSFRRAEMSSWTHRIYILKILTHTRFAKLIIVQQLISGSVCTYNSWSVAVYVHTIADQWQCMYKQQLISGTVNTYNSWSVAAYMYIQQLISAIVCTYNSWYVHKTADQWQCMYIQQLISGSAWTYSSWSVALFVHTTADQWHCLYIQQLISGIVCTVHTTAD